MRALILLSALLSACGQRTCDAAACAEPCAEQGVPTQSMPESGRAANVLTPYEAAALGPHLAAIRQGAQAASPGIELCAGTDRCEAFAGGDKAPLAPGTYHLEIPYTLTALAHPNDWTVKAAERCTVEVVDDDGHRTIVRQRVDPEGEAFLAPGGGTVRLLTVVSPGDEARTCAWRVTFSGPDGRTTSAEGTYRLPRRDPPPQVPAPPTDDGAPAPDDGAPAPDDGAPALDDGAPAPDGEATPPSPAP
ncbi:MAG: hypothetical protein H6733_07305 [Alphaproteobacteria bacterium]|nr:hypothetical protein [Alphaproteobacteria bacterium]